MKTKRIDERAIKFLRFLERYRKDKGAMANLRGALSEARRPRVWSLLGGFKDAVAIGNPVYETIAALWAHAKGESDDEAGNLGSTLRKLCDDLSTFEGRFKRILSCERDDIAKHVAPIVRAAITKGVGVDFARLLSDLLWWGEDVEVEWAKAFWVASEVSDELSSNFVDAEELPQVKPSEVAT